MGVGGWGQGKTPEKVEEDLMALVPRDRWIFFGHLLIAHGRTICHARKPLCGECFLFDLCPSAFKNQITEEPFPFPRLILARNDSR